MFKRHSIKGTVLCSLLGAVIGFGACSDDTGPTTKKTPDKKVVVIHDLGPQPDGPVGPKPDIGKLPDGVKKPDGPVGPATCDPACQSADKYKCVKETTSGKCVECMTDAHCKANPTAWGPKCNTQEMYCFCASNADCSTNPNGAVCDQDWEGCVCNTNTDCKVATYPKCGPDGVCVAACKADADCSAYKTAKFCNTTTGDCVQCKADADCKAPTPFCDAGACVVCKSSTDCALNDLGQLCDKGACICKANTDCTGVYVWGSYCNTTDAMCGCTKTEECATSAHGPTCIPKSPSGGALEICTCANDTECKKAPYTKCALWTPSYTYLHCQKPCTGDPECVALKFKKCDAGKCVMCSADADCAAGTNKFCQTTIGLCVACKTNADCPGFTPFCDTTGATPKCVACKVEADCANNPNGPKCSGGACGCTASTDCAGAYTYGKLCTSSKVCGCATATQATDCAGVPAGSTCTSGKCSCKLDADCKTTPYTKCGPYSSSSTTLVCQKPCTGDADCKLFKGLPKCQSSSGKCVECLATADCPEGICDTAGVPPTCVECLANTDCAKSPWGAWCDTSYKACGCKTNPECAAAKYGKVCDTKNEICGCTSNADCTAPDVCTPIPQYGIQICLEP